MSRTEDISIDSYCLGNEYNCPIVRITRELQVLREYPDCVSAVEDNVANYNICRESFGRKYMGN